jgi:inward rectifier potassium channel
VVVWYSVVNLLFTFLYYLSGVQHLAGLIYKNNFEQFFEVYFFSAQTLTTVGYGRINPMGIATSTIASFEALVGLLSFALFTGLLYARFAKPRAILMHSEKLIFAPYKDGVAMMFRMANKINSSLMNMKVQVTLAILEYDEYGVATRKFYTPLNLERDFVIFFPSSWTIVHPIDEQSPLYGMHWEAIRHTQPEVMVLASGFDETFADNVHSRWSYSMNEMIWGAKFGKILDIDEESKKSILDLGKFNDVDMVDINGLVGNHNVPKS